MAAGQVASGSSASSSRPGSGRRAQQGSHSGPGSAAGYQQNAAAGNMALGTPLGKGKPGTPLGQLGISVLKAKYGNTDGIY